MPMKSVPSGSALSLCHTIAGLRPVTSSSATARSRSQFDPGKTMTALFIHSLLTGALDSRKICGKSGRSRVLEPLDPEIFDDRVGQQLAAHILDLAVAGAVGEVELDQLAGTDIVDARKAEAFERMVDRLALRVEDAVLERDEDARFHGLA